MIGISQLTHCHGNSITMAIRVKANNCFVLSHIETVFGMEVP